MTLRVSVEAPNGAGGEALTGMTEILLPYEADAGTPAAPGGAFVSNANYEPVALAPFQQFSFFGTLPGREPLFTDAAAWPNELGGVQLLIDGKAETPLLWVSGDQMQGLVPLLAPGRHVLNVLYNGKMGGAQEFDVAEANPSALMENYVTRSAHIYDAAGRLVTRENPMKAGEVYVLYASGLGKMRGMELTPGAAAPAVAMEAEKSCRIQAGENAGTILYCGRSPGSISFDQVNFQMPALAAAEAQVGDVVPMSLVLSQEGAQGSQLAQVWVEVSQPLSEITISVGSNFPDAKFVVDGKTYTGKTGILQMASGTEVALDVPADPQVPAPDSRYEFFGWSQ
jgi:uncharacterized protein (TIGR03437 family)